ncbi:P-loop containing nucleoside triphosphate hydrolase protein [Mycotypha africana]|uniref:P-loop containing nucleoside triphosphate hydrolase protein n=1 Tax=Mycotypha africana TaxID=64632 RepID=UPI0023005E3C|nr:P-loop containing nucleoside triphosphate hydrolase protein [Mycotypha africana]KAI8979087.1 P-loop containing nucleoside triphosphate hydrolase protein [Mycotypha africana]
MRQWFRITNSTIFRPLISSSFLLCRFQQKSCYTTAITFDMLRPYQKDCIETTLREFENGCNKQIVSLPVGSGKTVVMSNLIPKIPCPTPKATKVLLLAHRTELLDQAYNQITRYNPNLNVQIEQGKRKADIDSADVIIASVPTLGRKPTEKSLKGSTRLERFQPDQFKAILIDEAHHAVADTYTYILDYFGVSNKPRGGDNDLHQKTEDARKELADITNVSDNTTQQNTDLLLWGCTATAKRHDGLALKAVFDKITFHIGFMEMIEQGYLCPMRVTTVDTQVDLTQVKLSSSTGDFVKTQLAEAVNTKTRNQIIVSSWRKYAQQGAAINDQETEIRAKKEAKEDKDAQLWKVVKRELDEEQEEKRQMSKLKKEAEDDEKIKLLSRKNDMQRQSTLVFAVDIQHTVQLCNAFIDAGIHAKCITSKTNAVERISILKEFRERKLPVLVNCAILTEGTDIPSVDCILLARPTKSTTLFQQMFGRGLRLFPNKKDCLVIDFVDNFKRTGQAELEKEALKTKEKEDDNKHTDIDKETEEEEEEEEEKDEDLDRIKIRITEYDSLQELIADFSVAKNVRAASHFGWVDVGQKKCVLHVLTKGFLVLEYETKSRLWKGTFRYANTSRHIFSKPFQIPLEASDVFSAIRAADSWVVKKFGNSVNPFLMSRKAPYRSTKATPAQMKALARYKLNIASADAEAKDRKDNSTGLSSGQKPSLTKGQAMDLLTKLRFGQMNLWKQQFKLEKEERKAEEQRKKTAVLARFMDANTIKPAA